MTEMLSKRLVRWVRLIEYMLVYRHPNFSIFLADPILRNLMKKKTKPQLDRSLDNFLR
jgi:hypothetical protein